MTNLDQIYTEYYTRVYSTDEQTLARTSQFYEALLGRYLPAPSVRLLDLGCGGGQALRFLRSKGFTNVSGVEQNAEQARVANQLLGESLVSHASSSLEWLRQREGSYDFILCTDVLEHIPLDGQVDFVSAVFAALAPGGAFLCTTPNANSAIEGRWRYLDFTHKTSFTETSLDFLLRAAGFSEVSIHGAEIFRVSAGQFAQHKDQLSGLIRTFTRALRRLEMIAELGFDEGLGVPLTVNLLGLAQKR